MKFRPIFALFIRSLREDSRAKFTPIARAALVLVILFFIAVNQRSFARRTAPGLEVFFTVMCVNLGGLVIVGISSFCSAITEEKEDDTLGLLRMTNLNSLAILLGKGTSRFVAGALLLLAQLPFSMLCVTLGGVSAAHILKGYEVLLCTLFLLCNLGLLMSVIAKKTALAVALTLLVGVVLYAGGPIAYIAYYGRSATPPTGFLPEAFGYVFSNHPILILGSMLWGAPGRLPVTSSPLLFHAVFGLGCFFLAWALFNRFCSGTADTAPRKKPAAKGAKLLCILRPGSRPVAWKDFWFLIGGRSGLIVRYVGYGVLTLGFAALMLFTNGQVQSEDVGEMLIVLSAMAMAVELILIAARIFGVERKMLTLSSLITLPVPLGRIIRHKLIGALPSFIPGVTYMLVGMFIAPKSVGKFFTDIGRINSYDFRVISYIAMHLIAIPLLACWFSLKLRRAVVAATIAITLVVDVIFGVIVGELNDRSAEEAFLIFGTMALIIISAILLGRIAALLPKAAAAD